MVKSSKYKSVTKRLENDKYGIRARLNIIGVRYAKQVL